MVIDWSNGSAGWLSRRGFGSGRGLGPMVAALGLAMQRTALGLLMILAGVTPSIQQPASAVVVCTQPGVPAGCVAGRPRAGVAPGVGAPGVPAAGAPGYGAPGVPAAGAPGYGAPGVPAAGAPGYGAAGRGANVNGGVNRGGLR